jgi:hypothetical protein
MGHLKSGRGVVVVVRLRRRNQARCTCGWIGKASLLLSSAKVDALLHAAREDCEPGIPLSQPGAVVPPKSSGVLRPTTRWTRRQRVDADCSLFRRLYLSGTQRSSAGFTTRCGVESRLAAMAQTMEVDRRRERS